MRITGSTGLQGAKPRPVPSGIFSSRQSASVIDALGYAGKPDRWSHCELLTGQTDNRD